MPQAVVASRATDCSYTVILRKFLEEGGDPAKQEMHGVRCQRAGFLVLSVIEQHADVVGALVRVLILCTTRLGHGLPTYLVKH